MDLLFALLIIFIGLIACFAGYRLFMTLLPMWGFFAGLWLGITGLQSAFGVNFLAGASGLVIGFVLGMILALLAYMFYFLGVFILGGSIGYSLTATMLVNGVGMQPGFTVFLISMAAAVLFAILFVAFNAQKYLVAFLTALGGAGVVISGLLLLIGPVTSQQISTPVGILASAPFLIGPTWWLGWFALAALGFLSQSAATRKFKLERHPASRFRLGS